MLVDFAAFLLVCLVTFAVTNPAGLVVTGIIAAGAAVGWWYACGAYARLWNRRFHPTALHHGARALSATSTLLFIVAFAALGYVRPAAMALIDSWQQALPRDARWRSTTFRLAHQAVSRAGVEPEASPDEGSAILRTNEQTDAIVSVEYAVAALNHFRRIHPMLDKLLPVSMTVPEKRIQTDMRAFFATATAGDAVAYPLERSVLLAAAEIRDVLLSKLSALVRRFQALLVSGFLVLQMFLLLIIGLKAYREIRLH